jgi:hypothetical protein
LESAGQALASGHEPRCEGTRRMKSQEIATVSIRASDEPAFVVLMFIFDRHAAVRCNAPRLAIRSIGHDVDVPARCRNVSQDANSLAGPLA